MKHSLTALFLVLALLLSPAAASEAPAVTLDIVETAGAGGSFVRYPVLSGGEAAQASVLDKINREIREMARIDEYLLLLQTVSEGGTGLKMTCEYALGQRYVSVLLSAEGKMLSGRPSQIYYPMTFDLTTGEKLTFDDLCDDPADARAAITESAANDIAPMLSTYLENARVLPVPFDRFFLSGDGDVTFYYDNADLSFLSGRSGAVSVLYADAYGLGLCEGSPAQDLDAQRDIMADAREGRLQRIGVGDSLDDTLARFPAASDSGFYPGGAYYETEDARLRGTYILTDEAETVVTGILCKRCDAGVIVTGVTTRDMWREAFGEPDMTMPLAGAAAQSYLLCDGESDYYLLGERQLILHADKRGVLDAILLK